MTYTAQQIVDTAFLAFGPLGLPRSIRGNRCAYAGPGGTGCAVGVLVPRHVAERMDEISAGAIGALLDRFGGRFSGGFGGRWKDAVIEPYADALRPHRGLLCALQLAHDTGVTGRDVALAIQGEAHQHGLLDPARLGDDADAALAELLGDAFRETHDNLVPS